ncbi:hypothetical protein A3A84_02600 [Candidatus Collierbacteria bacterium RIFCSPLOWO2_01_FULL_50_23]|uniref:Uncharacterized protein n=1 Tax=Candidatus Collierbacteria bacterium RIFCSPHIGHO2_01_FULL_50_25 TaxID=1817722 RepID=A0A1F5EYJ0_9BACT|nr:MAG: hypothetical protein A2703_04170 [Candidatus Collierbacteria bacterium RIFCSPHIGHO2_01_FULL_50_25]OGD75139.1 MAG: hypothetical protein A3A84_02600 [Candidatus Collierbacteria bacterium RIFCSPLOWO2_01_FULL_50_23]
MSLVLLFLGEGLFNFGLYWPVLFSLTFISKKAYWYGFLFGVLVSVVTATPLGVMSLTIVAGLFIFERVVERVGGSFLLVTVSAIVFNLISDKLAGANWSIGEGLTNLVLTWLLFKMDFFNDDLHLASR